MEKPFAIGLDLAKNVFQVHGVSATGMVVCRRQLQRAQLLLFFSRSEPCLVGMEACDGAHHWGRENAALRHEVRLMPPAYVKPYVKRGKADAVDAPDHALCAGEIGRDTGSSSRSQDAGFLCLATDADNQCNLGTYGRVRRRGGERNPEHRASDRRRSERAGRRTNCRGDAG